MQLFWEENYLKMEEAKLSWGLHKTKSFYLCKTFAHYFQQDKFQSIASFPFKIANLLELERIPDQTFASSKGFFIESAIMAQFGQNVPKLNILDWKKVSLHQELVIVPHILQQESLRTKNLNGPGWWEPCGFKQAQKRQCSENRFSPSAELAPCSTGNVFNFHKSGLSDQVLL